MIYIGSDHPGFNLKEEIKKHLSLKSIDFKDCGCYSAKTCDYPDIAKEVCKNISSKEEKAILVCGTGVGMSIVANKFPGVRAVCAFDSFSVKHSRLHNNANVFCIGARVVGVGVALELLDIFLETSFEGGRHERRVLKIED